MKSWSGPSPDIPSPFPSSKFCPDFSNFSKPKGWLGMAPLIAGWCCGRVKFPSQNLQQCRSWPVTLMEIYFYCWTLSIFQSLHWGAQAGQAGLLCDNEIYTHSSLCLERVFSSPKASGWNGSLRDCANLYTLNNFFSASAFHLKKYIIKKDGFLEIG